MSEKHLFVEKSIDTGEVKTFEPVKPDMSKRTQIKPGSPEYEALRKILNAKDGPKMGIDEPKTDIHVDSPEQPIEGQQFGEAEAQAEESDRPVQRFEIGPDGIKEAPLAGNPPLSELVGGGKQDVVHMTHEQAFEKSISDAPDLAELKNLIRQQESIIHKPIMIHDVPFSAAELISTLEKWEEEFKTTGQISENTAMTLPRGSAIQGKAMELFKAEGFKNLL